jgi:hypothetical protein
MKEMSRKTGRHNDGSRKGNGGGEEHLRVREK